MIRADLLAVRLAGALLDARRLLDQLGRGRLLRDERERAVLVDRELDRDHLAGLRLRGLVVLPAEVHDVHAVLAERRPDRGRGRGRAGLDLELDDGEHLLASAHRAPHDLLRFERPSAASRSLSVYVSARLDLRHLVEGQLDRRLPVEDVDHHPELGLLDVDLADRAGEVGERARDDPHHVALLPLEADLRLLAPLLHRQDLLDLARDSGVGLVPVPPRRTPSRPACCERRTTSRCRRSCAPAGSRGRPSAGRPASCRP